MATPAFPVMENANYNGLTKLEWMSGMVMTYLTHRLATNEELAKTAVELARAILKECDK
jgi:hypothetical protein